MKPTQPDRLTERAVAMVTAAEMRRIDAMVVQLRERMGGERTRSDALRLLIRKGLEHFRVVDPGPAKEGDEGAEDERR